MWMRDRIGFVSQAVAWFVIIGISAVLIVAVLIPRLAGATPYSVMTGSMRPGMPPGTLVVVKPKPINEIQIGDVVTYQLRSGEPTVVTHRVVALGIRADGAPLLQTQGDANNVPDAVPVREIQIKGAEWYSVPYLGYVNRALTGSQRQVAVYVTAGALLLYAGWMFTSTMVDRRRKARENSTSG